MASSSTTLDDDEDFFNEPPPPQEKEAGRQTWTGKERKEFYFQAKQAADSEDATKKVTQNVTIEEIPQYTGDELAPVHDEIGQSIFDKMVPADRSFQNMPAES